MWTRQAGWVHRTVFGQGLLAHTDGRRRTLQGLAATVWMVLDEPADDSEVLTRLRSIDPTIDIDPANVTDALQILADAGVVAADDRP